MKFTNHHVYESIDYNTGETKIIEKEYTYSKKHIVRKFAMINLDEHWNRLIKPMDLQILIELSKKENRETYLITADKNTRADLKKYLDISDSQVTLSLKNLVKHNIIVRVNRGSYMINPDCIWVGNETMLKKRIDKWLELTVK